MFVAFQFSRIRCFIDFIADLPSSNHSHRSSRDDGSRNEEWGTGNGTLDAFLHCRNENVPAFLCPGTTFPERGTQGRYRSPCSWPFASCNMVLTSCEKIVCLEDGLPEDLKETWLECTDDVASLFSLPGWLHPPPCWFGLVASGIVHRGLAILSVYPI